MTESRSALPGSARPRVAETKMVGPVDSQQMITVSLVIRYPPGSPPVPDLAHWSTTPLSERRHMSPSEYVNTYSATKSDIEAVHTFATAHGLRILDSHAGRRTVSVHGTVTRLNAAFGVQLNNYEAPVPQMPSKTEPRISEERVVETYVHHSFDGAVSLPKDLTEIVVAVVGLDNRRLGGPSGDPPGYGALSVPTVAGHYNFPNLSVSDQTIGVHAPQTAPMNGASYLASDITGSYFPSLPKAYQTAPTSINDINLTVGTNTFSNNAATVMGISATTNLNSFPYSWIIELTQDISTSATTAQGANVNVYFTELSEQGYLIFLNRVLIPEGEKQPTVVTSSFFIWQTDDTATIGSYTTPGTISNLMSGLFQQLALVGVMVFIAAGDSGASSGVGDKNDHLQYAGSDPWVTSCGGTVIANQGGSPPTWLEWAWNDGSGITAGGVSDNFPVPSYQTAAGITQVTDSKNNIRKGRFVPDISGMIGLAGFVVHGVTYSFFGTSCVAPLYAGLFATLRHALGLPLGFLNPTLYQLAKTAFNDVTTGNNDSGNGAPFFSAVPGYDACTGLGSVDGTKMLNGIAGLMFNRSFYFQADKNTFGLDEVANVSSYPTAFWLVLEGFPPNSVGPIPTLSGQFDTASNVKITVGPGQDELTNSQFTPQRIIFPCSVVFSPGAIKTTSQGGLFPSPGSPPIQMTLGAQITAAGQTLSATMLVELTAGADPYFTNINPSENNVFYLSQDLRVFVVTPGLNKTPISGGPTLSPSSNTAQDTDAAYKYIQALATYLSTNYGNPAGVDPFTLFPNQSNVYSADSSVTPSQFNPSDPSGPRLTNYNFAVARVRLTGTPNTKSDPVKVFFRLWVTTSYDTDYDPNTTYKSTLDNVGLPSAPLTGTTTIPFFATGNYAPNGDYGINHDYTQTSVNNNAITIGNGGSQWAYYGCFLNVYSPTNVVNGKPVVAQLVGTHHCLVAQIAFDSTPIINTGGVTESPERSDKLAQRNLQITLSDNPGPSSTHRIPQAFDTRPSAPISSNAGFLLNYPDELMIDWTNTPIGSMASIYWPGVESSDVLALAKQLYSTHQLSAVDEHTIQCVVPRGKTYVPIPPNGTTGTDNFAGLFTVDLPPGIVTGEAFDIVVRRISTRRVSDDENPPISISATIPKDRGASVMTNWRYVVGTFGVHIPVSTAATMLPSDEDALAILKWRLEQLEQNDRWLPVLQRYVTYISERIEGLGGNPGAIKPSPGGAPHKRRHHHHRRGLLGEILSICCCGCI